MNTFETNTALNRADPMVPLPMRVRQLRWETEDVFSIELGFENGEGEFRFVPGQFNMLYSFGVGESAISISSDSSRSDSIIHTIHKVGYVTSSLGVLKRGDTVGVRGPFGTGWPLNDLKGKNVWIIAGGIGLAPLRPALYYIFRHRKDFGKLTLLYGARSPRDILYPLELENWKKKLDITVEVTVDRADTAWAGHVGVVTSLIQDSNCEPQNFVCMMCGPEVMMKYSIEELKKKGIENNQVYVSLERNMKCAVGFCGHCQYGPNFVCKDGPVFNFSRVKQIFEIREL
jgi:NAD(P)H-flavin reductase